MNSRNRFCSSLMKYCFLKVLDSFEQFWTIERFWTGRFKPVQKGRFLPLRPKLANPEMNPINNSMASIVPICPLTGVSNNSSFSNLKLVNSEDQDIQSSVPNIEYRTDTIIIHLLSVSSCHGYLEWQKFPKHLNIACTL